MQIYLAKSGQQTGPYTEEQLRSMLAAGTATLSDKAWREGFTSWVSLEQLISVLPSVSEETEPAPNLAGLDAAASAMYLYIPLARLIFMSLFTFGSYQAYWIYRNWRYLQERDGLPIQPFWRGIFGVFFIYSLLHRIKHDPKANRVRPARFFPGVIAAGWIIFGATGRLLTTVSNPVFVLIGVVIAGLSFLVVLPVQKYINSINEASDARPDYHGWSVGHNVCLFIGILICAVNLIEFLAPGRG